MKKFLSLVLALVMTMSLVTVAGAKDFTDAADVEYAEAVDVLTAVGVIDGYTDGSFRPEVQLNRGQAAKIICNLILGPTTAEALPTNVAPFADVAAGSTFAGYIAYCAQEGIINGYTDGTFRPAAPLNGYAFMKMLLGALGYKADVEGYVGSNYAVAVAKRALSIGLTDDLVGDFKGTDIVTRQEAMLYAFNALKANEVTYPNSSTISVGNVTVQTNADAREDNDPYYVDLFKGDLTYTTGLDSTGRPSITWDYDGDEVGTYAEKAVATYTTAVKQKVVYKDMDLSATYTFSTTVNGKTSNVYTDNAQAIVKNSNTVVAGSGDGIVTEFYLNKDKTEGYMVQVHPVIGKVTTISKNADDERIIYVDGKTFVTEEFAKNDWVIYTTCLDELGNTVIDDMYLAEKLTGEVTLLKGSDEVYIDGAKFVKSDSEGASLASVVVGDVVDYYVDAYGNLIKVDVSAANINLDNIAFVEKANQATDDFDTTYKATLRKPDGSKVTVTTDVNYNVYQSQVVTYKVNADGDTELADDAKFYYNTGVSFTKGNPALDGKIANSNTQFVYVVTKTDGKTSVNVYDGYKNAPSFGTANVGYYAKDGKVVLAYVYAAEAALTPSSTDATYVVYNKDAKVVDDGDSTLYYEFAVIENGKIGTAKIDAADWATVAANEVTGYQNIAVATDGVASLGSALSSTYTFDIASKVEAVDAEAITVGTTTYAWDDDVKVFFVNADLEIREGAIDEIYEGTVGTNNYDSYAGGIFTVDTDNTFSIELIILCEK